MPRRIGYAGIHPGTGELRLTGDAQDAFEIFQVAPGTYRVEGRDDAATLTETSIGEEGNGATTVGNVARLVINAGDGNDEIGLANLRALTSLSINTEAGNDSVRAFNVISKGSADFTLGTGSDTVRFTGLTTATAGNLTIASAGSANVNFGAARTTISGALQFTGGTGSDFLSTSPETSLSIRRGISFNGGGGGADEINFGDQGAINIGRNASGQSIVYQGGSGTDVISIGASSVILRGSIEMDGSGGADLVDVDGARVTLGQNLQGVSVSLAGGVGTDEIDIQGGSVKVAGLIALDGGIEADLLDLTDIHRLVSTDSITLDGGAGADELAIEADVLRLAGGITLSGGDDADVASIEADGIIVGPVDLQFGGAAAGIQSAEIRGRSGLQNSLRIGGALTVNATGADATTDIFRLTNVVVAKATSLTFSDGASDIDIDNLSALGVLTIDTRGGSDNVRIERDAIYGVSVFARASTISLGAGDDFLRVGNDTSNNRVNVSTSLTVDGGAGTDARNDIEAENTFPGAATLAATEFEQANL